MKRLVEGSDSVFLLTGELCDDNVFKHEVFDEEPEQDSAAHRRRAFSDCTSRTALAFSTNSMPVKYRNRNPESRRRNSRNLRFAYNNLQVSRNWMRLIVVLIVICLLMSIVSLVLAVLTSFKVAKLEDSSLLAACSKGNQKPIDCKGIQDMRKSLKGALRELGKLAPLKNLTITEKEREENQNIVSNGTQGLPGASAAPKHSCTCNLTSCSYKSKKSTGISSGPNAQATVQASEPKETKILGVYCETNDTKVVGLSSQILDGQRTYKCKCEGTKDTPSPSLYCYIHYWECPI